MTVQNKALHDALSAYILTALRLISERAEVQRVQGEDELYWVRLQSNDDLAKLPEHQHCLEVLRGDSEIARQLDTIIGRYGRRSRTPSAASLMHHLLDLGIQGDSYTFDPERFEREYKVFEQTFYEPEILCEVTAPLQGLHMQSAVKLSEDIEISHLSDEELKSMFGGAGRFNRATGDVPCAVRTAYRLPKVIGDDVEPQLDEMDMERAMQSDVNDRVEEVINALRLFGSDFVYYLAIIHSTPKWLFLSEQVFPQKIVGEPSVSHNLDDNAAKEFQQWWGHLQNNGVKKRKFLDVAIRRFSYACERHRLEDKIIDLLIAAEALFMCDVKNEKYRGELQYRLAQRAGFFSSSDSATRRKIYQLMREAYNMRSSIVHGSAKLRLPKHPTGNPTALESVVWNTQEYIRGALHKAIRLAQEPTLPHELVKWDDLIFPISEEPAANLKDDV